MVDYVNGTPIYKIKTLIDRIRAIIRIRPLIRDTQTSMRAQTNERTDRHTYATKCIISLASRSIKIRN